MARTTAGGPGITDRTRASYVDDSNNHPITWTKTADELQAKLLKAVRVRLRP